jgi:hypothetical protein
MNDAKKLVSRARIFKRLCSSRIDSKELIQPAYVAWRAGKITLWPIPTQFLAPIDCLKIPAQALPHGIVHVLVR